MSCNSHGAGANTNKELGSVPYGFLPYPTGWLSTVCSVICPLLPILLDSALSLSTPCGDSSAILLQTEFSLFSVCSPQPFPILSWGACVVTAISIAPCLEKTVTRTHPHTHTHCVCPDLYAGPAGFGRQC